MCIQKNAYRYSYGRQANKTLRDIVIPENVPQWVKESKIQPISTKYNYKKNELNIQTWNNYSLDYLFDFVKGKRLTKADMLPGNVNFLGAISENNGVREKLRLHNTVNRIA